MISKNVLAIMFLVFTGTISASLQEKLSAKIEKITAAKQNVRADKSVIIYDKCSKMCRTCKGCTSCYKC